MSNIVYHSDSSSFTDSLTCSISFADQDMAMRHFGGGVGHLGDVHSNSEQTAAETSDDDVTITSLSDTDDRRDSHSYTVLGDEAEEPGGLDRVTSDSDSDQSVDSDDDSHFNFMVSF